MPPCKRNGRKSSKTNVSVCLSGCGLEWLAARLLSRLHFFNAQALNAQLNLLPQPLKAAFNRGELDLDGGGRIALNTPLPQNLLFPARQLQAALVSAELSRICLWRERAEAVKMSPNPHIIGISAWQARAILMIQPGL